MTCGRTGTQPAAHLSMPAQQVYRQPGLTGGSCLSSCGRGSAPHLAASRRQPATPETTLASRTPSQPPAAPASGVQHGGCRSMSSMTRPSAQTWLPFPQSTWKPTPHKANSAGGSHGFSLSVAYASSPLCLFLHGEDLHIHQILPIASVSAVLTHRNSLLAQTDIAKHSGFLGSTAHPMTREAALRSRYDVTTYHGALPPEGAEFHTCKAPGVLPARLNGRDTN